MKELPCPDVFRTKLARGRSDRTRRDDKGELAPFKADRALRKGIRVAFQVIEKEEEGGEPLISPREMLLFHQLLCVDDSDGRLTNTSVGARKVERKKEDDRVSSSNYYHRGSVYAFHNFHRYSFFLFLVSSAALSD